MENKGERFGKALENLVENIVKRKFENDFSKKLYDLNEYELSNIIQAKITDKLEKYHGMQ